MAHTHQDHRGHGTHAGHQAGQHAHPSGLVHGHAVEAGNAAAGTIKSIGDSTFVLATAEGDLNVVTLAGTKFHGVSRRRAREARYEDPTAINSFAALKVGQHVGVMGERRDDGTLFAERVHISEP